MYDVALNSPVGANNKKEQTNHANNEPAQNEIEMYVCACIFDEIRCFFSSWQNEMRRERKSSRVFICVSVCVREGKKHCKQHIYIKRKSKMMSDSIWEWATLNGIVLQMCAVLFSIVIKIIEAELVNTFCGHTHTHGSMAAWHTV